jgi:hypothetical protein
MGAPKAIQVTVVADGVTVGEAETAADLLSEGGITALGRGPLFDRKPIDVATPRSGVVRRDARWTRSRLFVGTGIVDSGAVPPL